MNTPTIFKFKDTHPVRVVDIDGNPWFFARDVCLALGSYLGTRSGAPNVTMAVKMLNPDEAQLNPIKLSVGGSLTTRKVMIISESGLYKLVMRSDKPEAKGFQDWVTRDVLPAIRKDGAYIAGEEKLKTGEMNEDEFILRAMEIMNRKVARLAEEKAQLEAQNGKLVAKVQELKPVALLGQRVETPLRGKSRAAITIKRSTNFCVRYSGPLMNIGHQR